MKKKTKNLFPRVSEFKRRTKRWELKEGGFKANRKYFLANGSVWLRDGILQNEQSSLPWTCLNRGLEIPWDLALTKWTLWSLKAFKDLRIHDIWHQFSMEINFILIWANSGLLFGAKKRGWGLRPKPKEYVWFYLRSWRFKGKSGWMPSTLGVRSVQILWR